MNVLTATKDIPIETLFAGIAPIDRDGKPLDLPKIGDGATYGVGSDSYPGTVIHVDRYGKTIVVTVQDDFHPWNKETGQHDYSPNPHGTENHFRLEAFTFDFSGFVGGAWVEERRTAYKWWRVYLNDKETHFVKSKSRQGVSFGHRSYYQNPSF